MFDTVVLAISIAVFLYVAYLLVKAYAPSLFAAKPIEAFVRTPAANTINMPPTPMPSPAPVVTQPPPVEERTISPGGPNPPNVAPDLPATIAPDAKPADPYDDKNMEAPIQDSMRFPELSFGPGVENNGTKNAPAAGTANAKAMLSESKFSPEFAQNGGIFMGAVTANDLSHGDSYANA